MPAARQMLLPVMPQPMLNPMHPPLAKELIAVRFAAFGDNALGWRYPATLFGALAIVAIYLCGLALFAAQGPAIAAALIAASTRCCYVQARIAMLDIFALTFGLLGIAAFMHGFRQRARRIGAVRARGRPVRPRRGLQMERPVSARRLHRDRCGDPPDAGLAHAVCRSRSQATGTGPISGPISGRIMSRSVSPCCRR